MVSMLSKQMIRSNCYRITLCCLPEDEKPTRTYEGYDIGNGSSLTEIGGDSYLYDEESHSWVLHQVGRTDRSNDDLILSLTESGLVHVSKGDE